MELTEQQPLGRHLLKVKRASASSHQGQIEQLESLAERLQHGDHDAAEELVDRYHERVFLYLRELGHSRETSEDLAQEAFLKAWNYIGQLRNSRALSSWLFRIVSNVSCEYWRKQHRRDVADQDPLNIKVPKTITSTGEDDRAGHVEELHLLLKSVSQLSWKLRQSVVLHYLQGFTISEAADVAGVKEGTFKSRLNRALETLRQDMGSQQGEL